MALKKKAKKNKRSQEQSEKIVIDEDKGLVFGDEQEIYNHFLPQIEELEKEYTEFIKETGEDEMAEFDQHEFYLTQVIQNPDEVWFSSDIIKDTPIGTFISTYQDEESKKEFQYIALTYFVRDIPRFVFLHFPAFVSETAEKYKRGTKIFDKNISQQGLEETVDALSEGDEFAVNLYNTMLKLRTNKDVPENEFSNYLKYRELTIEQPDEVWKLTDSQGNVLVRFIKNLPDPDEGKFYIVTTLEEETSESQYLLFSFPTNDSNFVDRFRQGECLEAVSYTREESH